MPDTEPAAQPPRPDQFPPAPPRRNPIVQALVIVGVSAAVTAVAFVLATALAHLGRAVQHDMHAAIDHVIDHVADRFAAAHCGPPTGR
ncbi:hypothetical protein [Amycolatopsis sp. NPDC004378]